MLVNILIFTINLFFLICAFLFIKYKLERRIINKEVINDIKKEINSIIVRLNKTTLDNVSLIEEKIRQIDKKIILASRKDARLKENITKSIKDDHSLFKEIESNDNEGLNNSTTYSPKMIKNMVKKSENQDTGGTIFDDSIEEKVKNLSIVEKAGVLIENGFSFDEIQKRLKFSSGELELLINTQNIRKTV